MADKADLRDQSNAMATGLIEAASLNFDQGTPLQQALVGTFLFGMLNAQGMLSGMTPPEVQSLAIEVFQDTLHYGPEAAFEGVQNCIDATGPDGHDTMKAIVHRGIDGHRQFSEGNLSGLAANIGDILAHFGASPS